jgi:hypothetical protein
MAAEELTPAAPVDAALAPLVAWLESRARAAGSIAELAFSMANDTYSLLAFRQALVFSGSGQLQAVSGLAKPTEDSPYLVWLRRSWPWLEERLTARPGWLELADGAVEAPPEVAEGWHEWWPRGLFALPLLRRDGSRLGWLCLLLDEPPEPRLVPALLQLTQSWNYCWEAMAGRPRPSLKDRWQALSLKQRRLIGIGLAVFFLLPVRQTSLAPAEVVARDAMAVTAPIDGVVKTVHVRPNQPVKAGDVLFSLDDTTLRNRLAVAGKSVAVADAELMAATQKAFDSVQSKGDLALLGGRAQERRAELAAVQAQLSRVDVLAPHDGVAVFGDPDDWLGRPVTTGERIMLLADPAKPGVLIHLPVANAVALETGAAVKLFLTVLPLSPMSGTLTETSYQAVLSPDGVASYRLRATFDGKEDDARIGLRGTAKIYGGWVCLGYYLLRRPLATLREWSGW